MAGVQTAAETRPDRQIWRALLRSSSARPDLVERESGLRLGEVEDAAGNFGQPRSFLEDIALEPLHGPVHVVGPDVEQRGVGIVDVLIGGSVTDAERGPVVGMKLVLRLPGLEVIGLDPDHDVLHDDSPLPRSRERSVRQLL